MQIINSLQCNAQANNQASIPSFCGMCNLYITVQGTFCKSFTCTTKVINMTYKWVCYEILGLAGFRKLNNY